MALMDFSPKASLLPPPNPSLYEEDDVGEDAEAQQLQQLLSQWVQAKKESEQKKGSKILEELQTNIETCLKKTEGQLQKEVKDSQAACEKEFKALKSQMMGKYEEIQRLTDKYNTDISKAWADYSALYGKLEDIKTEASSVAEKRRASLKRKISQAQGEIGGLMAEAEKRLVKCKAQGSKMPGVLKMFQQMM